MIKIFYLALAILLSRLSFSGDLHALAWIAMVPLWHALSHASLKKTLIFSFFYGFLLWMTSTWWISEGLTNIAGISGVSSLILSALPSLISAIPFLLIGLAINKLRLLLLFQPCKFAAIATLLVTQFPQPFPGNLAHSQFRNEHIIQLAGIGGTSLIFLLLSLSSYLLFWITKPRDSQTANSHQTTALVILIALFGICYLTTDTSLHYWTEQSGQLSKVRIGIIQPNLSSFYEAEPEDGLNQVLRQTEELVQSTPPLDLIVWPELPISFSVVNQPDDFHAIDALAKKIEAPLLLSALFYERNPSGESPLFYNAVHLIGDSAEPSATYVKTKLIPFGEYLPFEQQVPALRRFLPDIRSYTAGEITEPIISGKLKIAPAVCFEALYPGLIEKFSHAGANIIISPGNDGYFGDSAGAAYHLALSSFRAVEFRIPLVRVTNSGISEVIDISGRRLIGSESILSRGTWSIDLHVPEGSHRSDPNKWTICFCLLILLLAAAGPFYGTRKKADSAAA